MSVAEGIALYLEAQGHGDFVEGGSGGSPTIFINRAPATPDDIIVIGETGGYPSQGAYDSVYTLPTFQIRVRDESLRLGGQRARELHTLLERATSLALPTVGVVVALSALQPPAYIGTDGNQRHEYTFNLRVELQRKGA